MRRTVNVMNVAAKIVVTLVMLSGLAVSFSGLPDLARAFEQVDMRFYDAQGGTQ